MPPQWLVWAQRLQAIAQSGLTYATDPYDIERYEQLRDLAVDIAAAHTEAEPEIIRTLFTHDTGYATPKIDVRGVVFQEGKLLLVCEKADGLWTLPGGWADVGDSPAQAAEREIREESGYEAKAVKLLAVYDRNKAIHGHPPLEVHAYKLFFRCELIGGEARTSLETTGVGWYGEHELPELSTGRVTIPQIKRLFEHYRDASIPTDFD